MALSIDIRIDLMNISGLIVSHCVSFLKFSVCSMITLREYWHDHVKGILVIGMITLRE